MSTSSTTPWNAEDVPAVAASDLHAALTLWLVHERQRCVLVTAGPIATPESIEHAVLAMFETDSPRAQSVLVRLRSLTCALASRRFRHLVRNANAAGLASLVAAAARLRLNTAWGMSPVRLAWHLTTDTRAAAAATPDRIAA